MLLHYFDSKFGTVGQLLNEMWVILQVLTLDFPMIFRSFLMLSLKFMNIQIR